VKVESPLDVRIIVASLFSFAVTCKLLGVVVLSRA
jgi:hypothetical protein